jgi:hypothetical protein
MAKLVLCGRKTWFLTTKETINTKEKKILNRVYRQVIQQGIY